jgi:type III pantothenate kinase
MTKTSRPDRLLCIDAGNSRVKAAVRDGDRWRRLGAVATREFSGRRTVPWTHRQLRGVTGAVVSSVVPRANARIADIINRLTGVNARFVTHRSPFPFRLDVRTPHRIGVDRLCAAAGAVRHGARSAIVIDVGSAITVDLVTRGAYRGGLIMAGPELMLRALGEYAEQLPVISFSTIGRPFDSPGRGTRGSMVLGAAHGSAGAIRAAVAHLRQSTAGKPAVVLTGGGAAVLRPGLPATWSHRPHLVLEGLARVWRLDHLTH